MDPIMINSRNRKKIKKIVFCQIILLTLGVSAEQKIPMIVPRLISILPHDPQAFNKD